MREKDTILIILGIIAVFVTTWFFIISNSLIELQEDVDMQKDQIYHSQKPLLRIVI